METRHVVNLLALRKISLGLCFLVSYYAQKHLNKKDVWLINLEVSKLISCYQMLFKFTFVKQPTTRTNAICLHIKEKKIEIEEYRVLKYGCLLATMHKTLLKRPYNHTAKPRLCQDPFWWIIILQPTYQKKTEYLQYYSMNDDWI